MLGAQEGGWWSLKASSSDVGLGLGVGEAGDRDCFLILICCASSRQLCPATPPGLLAWCCLWSPGDSGSSLWWFSGTLDHSPKILFFPTPGMEPPVDKGPSWLVLSQGQDLAQEASSRGARVAVSPLSPLHPPGPCLLGLPVWAWKPVPDLVRTWLLLTSLLVIRQSSAWAEAPLTGPSLRPGPEGQGRYRTQQEPAMGVGRSGQWEGGEMQLSGCCGLESVLRCLPCE